jgi:hypothetical protein
MERKLWPSMALAIACMTAALIVALANSKDLREGQEWAKFPLADLKAIEFQMNERTTRVEPLGTEAAWIYQGDGKGNRIFLGGARMRDLWFALSPMWATRSLGQFRASKADDYGLGSSRSVLRILRRDGKAHEFAIGSRGFQSSDHFVLDKASDQVFLWNRKAIDDLMDPGRLALTSLSFLNPEGLNAIRLSEPNDPARTRSLVKRSKLWSEDEKPVAADEPLLNWLARVSKLGIKGYRTRGSSSAQPLLRAVFETESHWDVTLVRLVEEKAYLLDLGPGKPQILLDNLETAALWNEWAGGKLK